MLELNVEADDIIEALRAENTSLREEVIHVKAINHRLMRQLDSMLESEAEEEDEE